MRNQPIDIGLGFARLGQSCARSTFQHANRVWKEKLAAYEQPALDPAIEEELDAFVARRKAEGGVPTDF